MVTGEVRLRPGRQRDTHLATGKDRSRRRDHRCLAKSDAVPFQVSTAPENESENKLSGEDATEGTVTSDLRRPSMQHHLELRSDMAKAARTRWEEMDFHRGQRLTFIKSTEGARVTSVVPARLVPGSWYALPQSRSS